MKNSYLFSRLRIIKTLCWRPGSAVSSQLRVHVVCRVAVKKNATPLVEGYSCVD